MILVHRHLPDGFGLSVPETLRADLRTARTPLDLSGDARLAQVRWLRQAVPHQNPSMPVDGREVLTRLDGTTAEQLPRMVDV